VGVEAAQVVLPALNCDKARRLQASRFLLKKSNVNAFLRAGVFGAIFISGQIAAALVFECINSVLQRKKTVELGRDGFGVVEYGAPVFSGDIYP
jgi:hypothetical protein